MNEILKIVPVLLYMFVGVISLVMAVKNLTSDRFLPFHEKAADKPWAEIDDRLKLVILTFMRLTGLGFLIMSILLIVFPIVNYFNPNNFYKFSVPVIAIIYCSGLFVINYLLYRKTSSQTPWKGSLYAVLAIIAGIIISLLN